MIIYQIVWQIDWAERPTRHVTSYEHRRRSDWNSGGTHGGTYCKKSCCRGKKHIFLHCNASNLVLKILQHDKIWGTIPPLQILGGTYPPVLPVIYAHGYERNAVEGGMRHLNRLTRRSSSCTGGQTALPVPSISPADVPEMATASKHQLQKLTANAWRNLTHPVPSRLPQS